jgi:hypothetical protein
MTIITLGVNQRDQLWVRDACTCIHQSFELTRTPTHQLIPAFGLQFQLCYLITAIPLFATLTLCKDAHLHASPLPNTCAFIPDTSTTREIVQQ